MITRSGALAVASAALAAAGAPPAALGTAGASLHGTVMAAGKPLGGAQVTLFAGSREGVSELGHARTGTSGSFGISYIKPAAGVLYVQAAPAGASRFRLQSVVGVGSGGGGVGIAEIVGAATPVCTPLAVSLPGCQGN